MSIYKDTMTFSDPKVFDQTGWHKPETVIEPICRNCKFWNQENNAATQRDSTRGECMLRELTESNTFDTLFSFSMIYTRDSFGCNHWRQREENNL